MTYTAPLVKLVKIEKFGKNTDDESYPHIDAQNLAEDWPWWSVKEDSLVRNEIQSDPRWKEWISKLKI